MHYDTVEANVELVPARLSLPLDRWRGCIPSLRSYESRRFLDRCHANCTRSGELLLCLTTLFEAERDLSMNVWKTESDLDPSYALVHLVG